MTSGWNQETKAKLTENIRVNLNDIASLSRQITRGSRSQDVSIWKSADNGQYHELVHVIL